MPRFLHEYTFPELLEPQKEAIVDWTGVMWAGPDRRKLNSPNPTDLWRAWQKSVQKAGQKSGVVPQHVMAYFQLTKGLSRPPKKGEIAEPRRFTWSPSKIMQFDTCPYQFAAQYYYKTLPYQETAATLWGTRVHAAAEDYMNGKPVTDPEAFKVCERWVKYLAGIPGTRFVEHKIGVDRRLQPAEWDAAEGRMILDFGVLTEDGDLILVDYKSGKMKDDLTQLKIYALMMALQKPEAKKIIFKYIWLKDNKTTGGELTRGDMLPIAKDLLKKIERMKVAWDSEVFIKRQNALCKNWCGVLDCPNCGRK